MATSIKSEENAVVITRTALIESVARETGTKADAVRFIIDAYEREIIEDLASATEDEPVVIRLAEGVKLRSEFCPAKIRQDNFFGGADIAVTARVKAKVVLNKHFQRRVNPGSRIP